MDSPEECSVVESVEENNLEIERVHCADDVRGNGSCENSDVEKSVADENIDVAASPRDALEKGGEIGRPCGSPPTTAQSAGGSTPPMTKGYGLKKWRRIRRDVVKDGSVGLDSSKVLKRGFHGSGNGAKPSRVPLEIGKDRETSVGSTSVVRNAGDVDGFASPSALDISFAAGLGFAAGADSDHSEDRSSSKSSTAASAPKVKHVLPAALGYSHERNRAKNLSGKGVGQPGKARIESSKKPREEEMVKIQKDHSRVESDLRSSSSVFMLGAFLTAGNGMNNGKPTSYYYSGKSDGAHRSGQYSEDGNTGSPQENPDVENISQDGSAAWEAEEETDENHQSSAEQDPLDRSMRALQSVQEALVKEVEKFGEIAKEPIVPIAGAQISNLMENVKSLEVTLEETRMVLQARESRISELEASLSSPMSPKEESASNSDLLTSILMDELESAFKRRIEAEIEYLAIVRMIQNVDLQSQLMLLTEQEAAREQKAMLDRLDETETKATMLKKRAEELEKASEDILKAEEVLKLQRRTCKATSCFFLQLLLLVFMVWFLIPRLSPQNAVVIPT